MHAHSHSLVDEIRPAGEIAPLVGATGLQDAPVVFIQLQKIHTLQDLVGELGVGNTSIRVQPSCNGIFLEHRAHPVVLAHISQEVDCRQVLCPVKIVDQAGCSASTKVQEP